MYEELIEHQIVSQILPNVYSVNKEFCIVIHGFCVVDIEVRNNNELSFYDSDGVEILLLEEISKDDIKIYKQFLLN